ncbi:hypothetical protein GCM10023096_79540 [Nonomuraea ferruginea]
MLEPFHAREDVAGQCVEPVQFFLAHGETDTFGIPVDLFAPNVSNHRLGLHIVKLAFD